MNILIVSATKFEIAPLLHKVKQESIAIGELSSASFNKLKIDILITGVGMTATAFYLGKSLTDKYDAAFNFGLAGSFNSNLEKGSVVNIIEDHFSELGAEDGDQFLVLKDIKLDGVQGIINDSILKNKILEHIPKVNGITVNKVHGNEESITEIFGLFHPITESMEGAAFLFACNRIGIPHAQIRAISNYVEKRNKANWDIPLAIENLNKTALEILDAF